MQTSTMNCELKESAPGQFDLTGVLGFDTVVALLAQGHSRFDGKTTVAVNLAGVTHADSAGLALLLEWLREARQQGRTLTYQAVPAQLHALARISEVADWLGAETK